ncbi:MAG: bifunctional (p)ppGpp synthetase/guanosine-3',5'-bis(diphosphate) 3'-pyrophosphohydrolase [Phycisphaeraceae bacterium]|nr:bifunctional (p)ppGpp synthetase/guanosine-3',5'-bis(diphosphate) 3'-pyrophosphohydrolase [Phycisphaeraceae bacterium]
MSGRRRNASEPPGALWREAAAFAARKHSGQFRRDGRTPYFAHVVRVAMTVSEMFGCHDEEVLAAALLHDLIEDTTTDYEDILERFGKSVAGMVASLTKNMAIPEAMREKEYDGRIAKADWRVRLIKLADVYDNLIDGVNDPRGKAEVPKRLDACRRAIALAERDAKTRAVSKVAVASLLAALKRAARKT